MSRKKKGNSPTKVYSIRLEPDIKAILDKKYGSLTKAIDYFVSLIKKGQPD